MSPAFIGVSILAGIFLAVIIAFLSAPIKMMGLFNISKNTQNFVSYKNLEQLHKFYVNFMLSIDNDAGYKILDFKHFRSLFAIKRFTIYLFDKNLGVLYPKHNSGQLKKDNSKNVTLNDINHPLIHAFVHNSVILMAPEKHFYFPLSRGENIIGVVEVEKENSRAYSKEELEELQFFILLIYTFEYRSKQNEINEEIKSIKERHSEDTFKKLVERDENLIRSARLEALGQMARGLAHEIKNPLTSIKLVISDTDYIEGEDISIVREEINRLDRLLGQFLSFARPKDYHFATVNPNRLITEIAYILQNRFADSEIEFKTNLSNMSPNIIADIDTFKQMLINIFENAIDAVRLNPEGRKCIEVTTKTKAKDGQKLLAVSIHDSGPGIDSDKIDSIFEPFFTKKEKGSGLGLSIVHNIVKAHKGRITAGNHISGGAVFEMTFPIAQREHHKFFDLKGEDIHDVLKFLNNVKEVKISEEHLKQYVLNPKTHTAKIIKEGKRVIGYISGQVIPPEAEIFDIAVEKNHRRRGLGKKLMTIIEHEFKEKKADKVFLDVAKDNSNALNFYVHHGYKNVGTRKDYYGRGQDSCTMKKDISTLL